MTSSYTTYTTEFTNRPHSYTDTYTYNNGSVTAIAYAGVYIDDYYYESGLGSLDEYNGRYCVTPEYPNGTYAYFMTIDDELEPVFPYVIGMKTKNTLNRPNIS